MPLLTSDKKHQHHPDRWVQGCGCQYQYYTDKSGHEAVMWLDICAKHYLNGRR